MNPQERQAFEAMKIQIQTLQAKVDSFYSPNIDKEFLKNLARKGFLRVINNLIFTNSSGREFENLFVEHGQQISVISAENSGYYVPFTAATSDTITTNKPLVQDEQVGLITTGALPGGLSTAVPVWIINVSGNTCQFSATMGGAAINITSTGTGQHYLRYQ